MKIGVSLGLNTLADFKSHFPEHEIAHVQIGRISPDIGFSKETEKRLCYFKNAYPQIELSHHAYPYNFTEQTSFIRNEWVKLAKENIKFVARIGCKFINFHLGFGIDAATRRTHYWLVDNFLIPSLREITECGEKNNICIHIENIYPEQRSSDFCYIGDRVSDFQKVFDAINSPFLRLCYDYGHGNLSEYGIEILRTFNQYLGSVHAHNNDQTADLHLSLNQGTIDWNYELKYLKDVNFSGAFILEGPVPNIKNSLKFLSEKFNQSLNQ